MMQTGHTSSASQHCADLAYGGYDDWYLPSKDELNQVYNNRLPVNASAMAHGGDDFSDSAYWSSTESSLDNVFVQWFFNSAQYTSDKDTETKVRAIRAFYLFINLTNTAKVNMLTMNSP